MPSKQYLETFTSPVGVAIFPWITKADTMHDASGVFHTDLAVDPEEAKEFIAKLEQIRDTFAAENLSTAQKQSLVARPVYKDELTYPTFTGEETDAEKAKIKAEFVPEPTGNVVFRFKLKNNVTTAAGETFSQTPVVVAAETGAAIEEPVYGGSIIRVRGQIVPYVNASAGNYGVTLRMKAVQVIDLVTGAGGGDSFWGDFDAEDAA